MYKEIGGTFVKCENINKEEDIRKYIELIQSCLAGLSCEIQVRFYENIKVYNGLNKCSDKVNRLIDEITNTN